MRSLGGVSITLDRKSTRLNSSHLVISYAVFCLKKNNFLGIMGSLSGRVLDLTNTVQLQLCESASRKSRHARIEGAHHFFFLNDPAPPKISIFPPPGPFPI